MTRVEKSFQPYFEQIRQALARIAQYKPANEVAFLNHPMAQDAILMRLHDIGENLAQMRRIDEERFLGGAEDSWHRLVGLRNIIAHGYRTIDQEQIWEILEIHLPLFAETLGEDDMMG